MPAVIPHPVHGEYNRNGYTVWSGDSPLYSAGNHAQDSAQPALRPQERLPLATIRQFCLRTAREMAAELGVRFDGVERTADE
jgi:hypothetical protein